MAAADNGGKGQFDDLATAFVEHLLTAQKQQAEQAAQEKKDAGAPGGWNRPFRSWEAMAAFVTLVLIIGTPVLNIRDDVRDVKTAQSQGLKQLADHETRLHTIETQQIESINIRDTRGKRLTDVEDANKTNQQDISSLKGSVILLQSGQTVLQKAVEDANRKLDDLLQAQRH